MMSLSQRGLTYCRQISMRMSQTFMASNQSKVQCITNKHENSSSQRCTVSTSPSLQDYTKQPYNFKAPSPYKNPGPRRYGYRQKIFDGGPLPRLEEPLKNRKYHPKDAWSKKRALFGQNDYIDILGDGNIHPADLISAPAWIKGFKGNELQRVVRRLNFEGQKIKQLYPLHYHNMWKRVNYMYKKYNQKRGKKH